MAVRFISSNIITSLGFTTEENLENLQVAAVGITSVSDPLLYPTPFLASVVNTDRLGNHFLKITPVSEATRLEKMILVSVTEALKHTNVDIASPRTQIIISTTKGNIDLLQTPGNIDPQRVLLWKMAEFIGVHFKNPNTVKVVSNACISGVLAINTAAMMLNKGICDHVIVVGADLVTRFVISGFMSFLSLSPDPCKPFDHNRDGLSLGEATGTLIMEKTDSPNNGDILFAGGATANDANHISGPSRTGEGSVIAIRSALAEAGIQADDIDHINAHGTATRYNDDMESIAIHRTEMEAAPVNSYKGSWGHTLGAAGVIETAALIESMRKGIIWPTAGLRTAGTIQPLKVSNNPETKTLSNCMKLASGFGGCNAALVLQKKQ